MPPKRFIIIVVIMGSVLAFGHYLVFATASFAFNWTGSALTVCAVLVSLLFPAAFIGAIALSNYRLTFFSRAASVLTALWVGFFVYFFLLSVLYWMLVSFFPAAAVRPLAELLFAAAFVIGCLGIANALTVRVTNYSVKLPNLPASWKGKKVFFFSDTHFGQIHGKWLARKIISLIETSNPEAVLIGGDLFDGGESAAELLASMIADVDAPKGIFYVTGNHEEFTPDRTKIKILSHHGIRVLNNELVNIDGLQIAGVDYRDSSKTKNFAALLENMKIDRSLPSVLLRHVPSHLKVSEAAGISLQLSGHTHRGQMFPGRLFTHRIFRGHDYGLTKYKGIQVITSSGAGTWGPPMKVGSISEVLLITLE